MTLITVDALRKRYPDCRIVMFTTTRDAKKDNSNYTFTVTHMSERAFLHARGRKPDLRYLAEGAARSLLGKGDLFREYRLLKELLASCDGVFDINGYAISSQFRNQRTLSILDSVDLFTGRGIPYYFMPQSFGPFAFREDREHMCKRLRETLPKAARIFAREQEGFRLLKELIGDGNLVESYDMVLQSAGVDLKNIYVRPPEVKEIPVPTAGNVAVIPNLRNFEHGSREEILELYGRAVEHICGLGKTVYLISHSAEDMEVCELIKGRFAEKDSVVLVRDRIDTWNYDLLIRKFDFAIASRFHSIVHAYRAGTPCIALGWATKYRELLAALGQERYLFDVRGLEEGDAFLNAIDEMNGRYPEEQAEIRARLAGIQETNCFDRLDF